MSLIHDALKKAQAPSAGSPKADFPQFLKDGSPDKEKIKKNIRIIALAVVLFAAMVYMVYDKFYAGKSKPITSKASAVTAEADDPKARQEQADKLKEEGIKAVKANRLEDAWIRLSTAGQLDPLDATVWNNMGLISRRKGDVIKAREFFEKALQIKPECPECLNNLAILDMEDANYPQAKERLAKALSLNPQYADAAFHMALIAEEQGDFRLAAAYYKKFIETKKDAPGDLLDQVRKHVTDLETE